MPNCWIECFRSYINNHDTFLHQKIKGENETCTIRSINLNIYNVVDIKVELFIDNMSITYCIILISYVCTLTQVSKAACVFLADKLFFTNSTAYINEKGNILALSQIHRARRGQTWRKSQLYSVSSL